MTDSGYPIPANQLVATLAAVFREQRNVQVADLLSSATSRIEHTGYDNWDGGTDVYTLFLEVPVERYAAIEPQLEEIQKLIGTKASNAARVPGAWLSTVEITPILAGSVAVPAGGRFGEAQHLWAPKAFRLFLSHVSAHRVEMAALKGELKDYGISSFVAHEDIEPSRAWQEEILRAITTMNGMAALLTPEFHLSNWTDQEVGMAIARRVLVIPVNVGMAPYGFMAANQAMRGDLANTKKLALDIAVVLAKNPSTQGLMAEALTAALGEAGSYVASRAVTAVIEVAPTFTEEQLQRMEASISTNSQVGSSFYVPDRIRSVIGRHRGAPP